MAAPLALVFPGQGSQSQGMMDAYEQIAEVRQTLVEASDILGWDLAQEIANGDKLAQTEITQPVMVAVGVAVYRGWLAIGGATPVAVAGHSVGEYAALVAAGAMDLATALPLVTKRALAMQQAMPSEGGAMCAVIGLTPEQVSECCAKFDGVWVANINSPIQTVIAGGKFAVEQAAQACKEAGAKRVVRLAMSVLSHCPLLEPAAKTLAAALVDCELVAPEVPVIHNVDNQPRVDPIAIKQALTDQLFMPINWPAAVEQLATKAKLIVETGPGRVLYGLNRWIVAPEQSISFDSAVAMQELLASE